MKFKSEIPALLNPNFAEKKDIAHPTSDKSTPSTSKIAVGISTHGAPVDIPPTEKFFFETYDLTPIRDVFDPKKELKQLREQRTRVHNGSQSEIHVANPVQQIERYADTQTNFEKKETQRIAHMRCRLLIQEMIAEDVDVSEEHLQQVVRLFAKKFGFSEDVLETYAEAINLFCVRRERAKKTIELYSDEPYELVKQVTGVSLDPSIPITIKRGPMSVDIYTNTEGIKLLKTNNLDKRFGYTSLDEIPLLNGFSVSQYNAYTVVNDDVLHRQVYAPNDLKGDKTLQHEHQHLITDLIEQAFESVERKSAQKDINEILTQYINEKDPNKKESFFRQSMDKIFVNICYSAKDEILAQLKTSDYETIANKKNGFVHMTLNFEKSPYNYLRIYQNSNAFKEDVRYHDYLDTVLKGKYRLTLTSAMEALKVLIKKYKYDSNQIAIFFTDTPLNEWKSRVKWLEKTERRRPVFHQIKLPTKRVS